MRTPVVVLFTSLLLSLSAVATAQSSPQTPSAAPPAQQTPHAEKQQPPANERPADVASQLAPFDLPLSLDRIRSTLAEPERPRLLLPNSSWNGQPTFRVRVYAYHSRTLLPDFKASLMPGWQAIAPGGRFHKEMLDMMTPIEARPYAAFNQRELVQVLGDSMKNAALGRLMGIGLSAAQKKLRTARENRIRREVSEELEAYKRQLALSSSGQSEPATPLEVAGPEARNTEARNTAEKERAKQDGKKSGKKSQKKNEQK